VVAIRQSVSDALLQMLPAIQSFNSQFPVSSLPVNLFLLILLFAAEQESVQGERN